MPEPYFHTDAAPVAGTSGPELDLVEDPLRPGELLVQASYPKGVSIRVRLDEARAVRTATALIAWYHAEAILKEEEADAVRTHQGDTVTQYRDGLVYSFAADPEV